MLKELLKHRHRENLTKKTNKLQCGTPSGQFSTVLNQHQSDETKNYGKDFFNYNENNCYSILEKPKHSLNFIKLMLSGFHKKRFQLI